MATKTKKPARGRVELKAPIPESLVNDATRVLDDASWPVGSAAAQGDIYLVRIDSLPPSAKRRANRQMAEGNTQGSRHVVTTGDCFDANPAEMVQLIRSACPKAKVEPEFIGPIFTTVKGLAELDHPEHGNYQFCGDMVVAVVVQRNLDSEQRAVRARD